jgi:pimeloyl-ACP methyl ester carboxylesterase
MEIARIQSSDGVSIGCELVGKGEPVVLVHGSSTGRQRWQPVVPAFAQRWQLSLLDRRGRGLSGDAAAHSLQAEVDDVVSVVRAANAHSIVSHSYGGICAIEAALVCSQLTSLVIYEAPIPVGAADPADESHIRQIEERVEERMPEEALLIFHRSILRMPEPEIAAMRQLPTWSERIAIAHTLPRELRAARGYRFDAARFAKLRIPVLVLLGGESPERYARGARTLIDGLPNARLATLAGQKHNAITTAPELFSREILNFVESQGIATEGA